VGSYAPEQGCEPAWLVRAGTIVLHRSAPGAAILVTDAPGTTVLLGSADFDFGFRAGPDVSLIRRGTIGDVECRFFRIDGWNAVGPTITSAAGAAVQFQTPFLFQGPVTLSSNYRSELENCELNFRYTMSDWLTLLAGFRYVELNERSLAMALDLGGGATADFSVSAFNALYGFQVGADALLWSRGGRLRLEGTGRIGAYNNRASNRSSLVLTGGPDYLASAATDHAALVGELGLSLVYQFTPRFGARAGYELLWIDGAALASEQLAATRLADGIGDIDPLGSAFFHGATVSLEYTW